MRRKSKFGNVKTRGFHSKREAAHDQELILLEQTGNIQDIQRQVPFDLVVNGVKVCRYIADHVYWDRSLQKKVIDDTKGYRTAIFNLKWKMLKAQYGNKYEYRLS